MRNPYYYYDLSLNWIISKADAIWFGAFGWFYSFLYPELRHLPKYADRAAVMIIFFLQKHAKAREERNYGRDFLIILGLIIGVPLAAWFGYCLVDSILMRSALFSSFSDSLSMDLGTLLGFAIAATPFCIHYFQHIDEHRRDVHEALTNLSEAVCPFCGYDLRGHLQKLKKDATNNKDRTSSTEITCPECGHRIPDFELPTED